MDILGKKGEEAKENVNQVSEQLNNLESHLTAVDTALQDFMENSESIMDDSFKLEEEEIREIGNVESNVEDEERDIEELEGQIQTLQSQVERMAEVQMKNKKRLQAIMDSELLEIVGRIRKLINTTNKRYYDLKDAIDDIDQRVNELENDIVLEVNSREYDFERKVDQNDYKMRNQDIKEELAKLRASVNVLADEMDKKEDIEVD